MGGLQGLTKADAEKLQQQYGKNTFQMEGKNQLWDTIVNTIKEPMFLMLLAACLLYFLLQEYKEGWMMIAAMSIVSGISLYQEGKSNKALTALRDLTEPKVFVIRDGKELQVDTAELVPGDIVRLEEGNKVPADATILQQNDLTINEAVITGESLPAIKENNQMVFQGTTVNTGGAFISVIAIGNETKLGKLGKLVTSYSEQKTNLRNSIDQLVRFLSGFGIFAFIAIFLMNYFSGVHIIASLLFALTLAMAVLPEEIPVAYTSFMALGAYRLSRKGIITRKPQTLEHLGRVSVICMDKTGTITENKMSVRHVYNHHSSQLTELEMRPLKKDEALRVLTYAVLASETIPFDEMEKAILRGYGALSNDIHCEPIVYEYPLQGRPPMMTHVYKNAGHFIVAAKGGLERIMEVCQLPETIKTQTNTLSMQLAREGYRILGVASAIYPDKVMPAHQDDFPWQFEGFISLYDPPRKDAPLLMKQFYKAGIDLKLLTGDLAETAATIAQQVGIKKQGKIYTGEEIMEMTDNELEFQIKRNNIFARMFPEAKIRVVEALKKSGEIVTMIGDGVNDGPAIKAAHIGIAMGKSGTEVAHQAADLVLTDDAIGKMIAAIEQGRRIFSNLNKAIRYIVSIHIPILLTASIPLLLGWKYPNLFTPIHIIFLELIMGPTCSIFFEREPLEPQLMQQKPNAFPSKMFKKDELMISITQGLIITAGLFILYQSYAPQYSLETVRTILFTTLLISNIGLTYVNRSFKEPFYVTMRYRNNLAFPILILSLTFLTCIHAIPYLRLLFGFTSIRMVDIFICTGVGIMSVAWFEIYKMNLNEIE
ncbi:cation-translocating P-type ATPase [Flavisolibacter tropicus]|uniref:Haloacid dehalogenase n=1 Tax=Flavisolibacter tropicus TaxID=1492898 RepID=A0A172TS07_9BACT|nr:cation-translocating P-type ATPase [Flavisolibacter tropicus]ANE49577.1 hypothetical protein SY85_02725 [Flavisolibacter tropicus]